ncbi:MAG: GNAT family N-acetyltransferase [Gemmatimonadota bacterium]
MKIRIAESDEDIQACFSVMSELRPKLSPENFVETIRDMETEGYRLAFLSVDGSPPVCVAGYRLETRLWCGRILYVDDLVTAETERSRGYGAAMLDWLKETARAEGCAELHLDSGVWRKDAHRFYRDQGMEDSSLHFRIEV